jgi:hypothetical protein
LKVRPNEFTAARLLCGLTQAELGDLAGVTSRSIRAMETGQRGWLSDAGRNRVLDALRKAGARFRGPGLILHVDGRQAPTREAVGRFGGWRITTARWHLRMTMNQLARSACVSMRTLQRLEGGFYLNRTPEPAFYRVIDALQRAGYSFGKRKGNIRGDACLVPRPPKYPRARLGAPVGAMSAIHEQLAAVDAAIEKVPAKVDG